MDTAILTVDSQLYNMVKDFELLHNVNPINLESEIKKLVSDKPGLSQGAYMGLVMNKFKGQVSGKEVMCCLKKFL